MSTNAPVSLSRHTLSQLKFVFPGAGLTFYLKTHLELWNLLAPAHADVESWSRTAALTSLALGLLTIALFLYVLLVPWIKGVEPNYRSWRESGTLSSVIPLMTSTILAGWSLLAFTLGRWSNLGYLEGIVAALSLYMLAFGLMGLIPAPKVHRS
ncbi:hypothetical protein PLICRDRAFT_40198 [Plicaturopsis crispa FD-325 SS-3]|nr:hypothetical protein PLICRDRAFT_40198 [Plicaturopsis crispa FD-325 SS-3]